MAQGIMHNHYLVVRRLIYRRSKFNVPQKSLITEREKKLIETKSVNTNRNGSQNQLCAFWFLSLMSFVITV